MCGRPTTGSPGDLAIAGAIDDSGTLTLWRSDMSGLVVPLTALQNTSGGASRTSGLGGRVRVRRRDGARRPPAESLCHRA